jgi:hypothetical protein
VRSPHRWVDLLLLFAFQYRISLISASGRVVNQSSLDACVLRSSPLLSCHAQWIFLANVNPFFVCFWFVGPPLSFSFSVPPCYRVSLYDVFFDFFFLLACRFLLLRGSSISEMTHTHTKKTDKDVPSALNQFASSIDLLPLSWWMCGVVCPSLPPAPTPYRHPGVTHNTAFFLSRF